MKESYSEGMANHAGLRSYAGSRKAEGGTLIEVRVGRVLSREISIKNWGADGVSKHGRRNRLQRMPMLQKNPTRSKTPSMHGNTLVGNWEIPLSPAKVGRVGKSEDARR
jgi:hypothetical protein